MKREGSVRNASSQARPECPRTDDAEAVDVKPSPAGEGLREALRAQKGHVPAPASTEGEPRKTAQTAARFKQEGSRDAGEVPDVPALALALAVEAAEARRRQAEWLAQRLASYGHSPTRKDGRELDCGHAFCRHGCAYCWIDAATKAASRAVEKRTRRDGRGKGQ